MMTVFLIDPQGRFVEQLQGETSEILGQILPGYQVTNLRPPRATDYWNGVNWVDIGPAPAWYFKFDYAAKDWIDTRSLTQTQAKKWEAIKLERNTLELSGFDYDGNRYDSDMFSQIRIAGAAVLRHPVVWTLQNNETIALNSDQVVGLGQALVNHVQACHERSRAARQAIYACTTVDQVDAIVF